MSNPYTPKNLCGLKVLIWQIIVLLVPLFIIAGFAAVYVHSPDWYLLLIREDGISEDIQAAAYFLASTIGVATAVRVRKLKQKYIYWLFIMFALGTLIIGFEEISWGQRIFGFKTPDVIAVSNTQTEFTAHNIRSVEQHLPKIVIIVGLCAALAWIFIRNPNENTTDVRRFITPDWYLSLYFILISAFNIYRYYIKSPDMHYLVHEEIGFWRHQEVFELLIALGLLFFALSNYKKVTELVKTLAIKQSGSTGAS